MTRDAVRAESGDDIGSLFVHDGGDPVDQVVEEIFRQPPVRKTEPDMAIGQTPDGGPAVPGLRTTGSRQLLPGDAAVGGDLARLPVGGMDEHEPEIRIVGM